MNLLHFIGQFPDEDSCRSHLREVREKQGVVVCKKCKVLDGLEFGEAGEALKNSINGKQAIVFTDQSTSYVDIADYVEMHISEKSSKETTKETLKWVHIAISDAKLNFVRTYNKILSSSSKRNFCGVK